jgi:hypothetical protein
VREGHCKECGRFAWINRATILGASVGEFCAACFELLDHDDPGRRDVSLMFTHKREYDSSFVEAAEKAMDEDR